VDRGRICDDRKFQVWQAAQGAAVGVRESNSVSRISWGEKLPGTWYTYIACIMYTYIITSVGTCENVNRDSDFVCNDYYYTITNRLNSDGTRERNWRTKPSVYDTFSNPLPIPFARFYCVHNDSLRYLRWRTSDNNNNYWHGRILFKHDHTPLNVRRYCRFVLCTYAYVIII